MFDFLNPQQLINKILDLQKEIFANEVDKTDLIKANYINEFSNSENSVRAIFDHINVKILHISDNVESLSGHSVDEIMTLNIPFVIQLFTLDHFDFLYVWIKWAVSCQQKYDNLFNTKQLVCGVKVKHKKGHIMRLLLRHYPIETTENGIATISAITIDDISHLIKSDFYWGRIEFGNEVNKIHHFVSVDKVDHPHDILSDREKSIVKLLALGKESKEIGAELFISSHTVDNHRRNMINKVGVRDTTGLIQICKMVGII